LFFLFFCPPTSLHSPNLMPTPRFFMRLSTSPHSEGFDLNCAAKWTCLCSFMLFAASLISSIFFRHAMSWLHPPPLSPPPPGRGTCPFLREANSFFCQCTLMAPFPHSQLAPPLLGVRSVNFPGSFGSGFVPQLTFFPVLPPSSPAFQRANSFFFCVLRSVLCGLLFKSLKEVLCPDAHPLGSWFSVTELATFFLARSVFNFRPSWRCRPIFREVVFPLMAGSPVAVFC